MFISPGISQRPCIGTIFAPAGTCTEDDGTTWTAQVTVDSTWQDRVLTPESFGPGRGGFFHVTDPEAAPRTRYRVVLSDPLGRPSNVAALAVPPVVER